MSLAVTPAPETIDASAPCVKPTFEIRLARHGMLRVCEETFTDEAGNTFAIMRVVPRHSQGNFRTFCSHWVHTYCKKEGKELTSIKKLGVIEVSTTTLYHYIHFKFHPKNEDGSIMREGISMETRGVLGMIVEIKEVARD